MMMVISGYMVYESLDGVSSFSSLFKIVDLAVNSRSKKFSPATNEPKGQDIQPQTSTFELDQIYFYFMKTSNHRRNPFPDHS